MKNRVVLSHERGDAQRRGRISDGCPRTKIICIKLSGYHKLYFSVIIVIAKMLQS